MHFQIDRFNNKRNVIFSDDVIPVPERERYAWRLVRADESVVCRSARSWVSERELRSDLAQTKKTLAGAMRYKVVSPS